MTTVFNFDDASEFGESWSAPFRRYPEKKMKHPVHSKYDRIRQLLQFYPTLLVLSYPKKTKPRYTISTGRDEESICTTKLSDMSTSCSLCVTTGNQ